MSLVDASSGVWVWVGGWLAGYLFGACAGAGGRKGICVLVGYILGY